MFGERGDECALARARADFMRTLFADMLGFGACKMIRRILGFAHVLDLDGIADTKARAGCEAAALAMAMALLKAPAQFRSIDDVIDAVSAGRP
jgi:5-methylthioribose kinase